LGSEAGIGFLRAEHASRLAPAAQDAGAKICAVRPPDGIVFDFHPLEKCGIFERLEDRSPQHLIESKPPGETVGKGKLEGVIAHDAAAGDFLRWSHGLFKRRDFRQGFVAPGAFPPSEQVALVERGPLDEKGVSFRREMAAKQAEGANFHLGFVVTVPGVEVRRVMIVPIHLDNDAIEF
jgi:hypothetical protein